MAATPQPSAPRGRARAAVADPLRPTRHRGSVQWPLTIWYVASGALGGAAAAVALGAWHVALPLPAAAGGMAAGAALGLVIGVRTTWELKRRLRPLTQGVSIFAAGGLRHRIATEGDDEITALGQAMNTMAERHAAQLEALQRLAADRAALSGEAARAAVLEERQRLARDLHDAVSQAIFSIAMMTAAARRQVADDPERALATMAEVEGLAAVAQREMRALLLELRPVELAGRPLAEAIGQFLTEIGDRYDVTTAFAAKAEGDGGDLTPALEDGLFRIAQEAVVNAVRHASPTRVEVRLFADGRWATLEVIDDGQGFDVGARPPDSHYGLRSMRERAQELGGTLTVRSAPGEGTDVEVRVPSIRGEEAVRE